MNIAAALAKIVTIQEALAITTPEAVSIAKVWQYAPGADAPLKDSEVPAIINTWRLDREVRSSMMRTQTYLVTMLLLVWKPDITLSAEICTEFMPMIIDAFDADVTLTGTVTIQSIRSGRPSPFIMPWGGRSYMALELVLELIMTEGKSFS